MAATARVAPPTSMGPPSSVLSRVISVTASPLTRRAFQSTALVVEENTTFGMSRQRRAHSNCAGVAPGRWSAGGQWEVIVSHSLRPYRARPGAPIRSEHHWNNLSPRTVEAGDADRAWALTGQTTVQPAISSPPRPFLSRDDYRQQVQNSRQATRPRIRILSSSQSGATATVELEVSHSSGDPLTGATRDQVTLSLTRQTSSWRITSDPFPGQVE